MSEQNTPTLSQKELRTWYGLPHAEVAFNALLAAKNAVAVKTIWDRVNQAKWEYSKELPRKQKKAMRKKLNTPNQ